VKIPDVNVWLAAVWSRHSQHGVAKNWIDAEQDGLAFCRVTQMALLRLLTIPSLRIAMFFHAARHGPYSRNCLPT